MDTNYTSFDNNIETFMCMALWPFITLTITITKRIATTIWQLKQKKKQTPTREKIPEEKRQQRKPKMMTAKKIFDTAATTTSTRIHATEWIKTRERKIKRKRKCSEGFLCITIVQPFPIFFLSVHKWVSKCMCLLCWFCYNGWIQNRDRLSETLEIPKKKVKR